MKYLRMDLKVCEGCGTLWLRRTNPTGTNPHSAARGVYCRACATRLADFPMPRGKHPGGRKPRLARVSCCERAVVSHGGAR